MSNNIELHVKEVDKMKNCSFKTHFNNLFNLLFFPERTVTDYF